MDLSDIHQSKLNAIARRLNERPRKTLSFETPRGAAPSCRSYFVNHREALITGHEQTIKQLEFGARSDTFSRTRRVLL